MRDPYILYRRPESARAGKVYNVGFWDAAAGKYVCRRSVGSLVDSVRSALPAGTSPITKAGARRIVDAWLQDHSPAPVRGTTVTLSDYLRSFWDPDGQYASSLRARGRSISLEYLANNRRNITNYVTPWIRMHHQDLALRDVQAHHIEALIMDVRSQNAKAGNRSGAQRDTGKLLSHRTVNAIRQSVTVALAEAARLGMLKDNPSGRAPKLAENATARGVLTLAEARAVLSAPWADTRAHAASLLAATTGMRLGEVRALTVDAIHDTEIEVLQSWSDLEGGKDPKWRSLRTIPVPAHVVAVLRKVAEGNPWGSGFVFCSHRRRANPVDKATLQKGLKNALLAIGIPGDSGITFHSWRHFYNSQMRDRLPDHALRQLTGHRSAAMTEQYSHITQESRAAAADLASRILLEAGQS
jgi:integrase